jgi:hypothetical protein
MRLPVVGRGRAGRRSASRWRQLKRQITSENQFFIHGKPAFTLKKITAIIFTVLEFSSA